jgi:hypothetical protein
VLAGCFAYASPFGGAAALDRFHKHTEQIAENVKRTLDHPSARGISALWMENLPQSNGQAPDRLDFQACGLRCADPLRIVDLSSIFRETASECRGEVNCTGASIGEIIQNLAIQVANRLADND